MPQANSEILLIVFVGLTGLAVLMQAIILIALYLSVRKMSSSIEDLTVTWHKTIVQITPIATKVQDLLAVWDRVLPKIEGTAENLQSVSENIRRHSQDVNETVTEIVDNLRHQGRRVDGIITDTLNTVDHVRSCARTVMALPFRQVNGVVAAFGAVVETLRARPSSRVPAGRNHDGDIFI